MVESDTVYNPRPLRGPSRATPTASPPPNPSAAPSEPPAIRAGRRYDPRGPQGWYWRGVDMR
jgi:hypothetical protein